jgi:hypothetical protein
MEAEPKLKVTVPQVADVELVKSLSTNGLQ